tara:strand:+ start:280 stop:402 length:123 start_codon:yes stop_codon:yes gene_type:complete
LDHQDQDLEHLQLDGLLVVAAEEDLTQITTVVAAVVIPLL